jgi:hypothetical protein
MMKKVSDNMFVHGWPEYKNLPHWFTFVVKWFVHGLNGPFGSFRNLSKKFLKAFYSNDVELAKVVWKPMPSFLLPSSNVLTFKQNDKVNCGICCLLFLIDPVASQADTSWEVPSNDPSPFPSSIKFGSMFFNLDAMKKDGKEKAKDTFLQQHLLTLYHVFREELILLMERLCLLYFGNIEDLERIEIPKGWGEIGPVLKALHKQQEGNLFSNQNLDQPGLATKIKKLKDNTNQRQLQNLEFDLELLSTAEFCYSSYQSVNQALGIFVGLEKDLEQMIHGMYTSILKKNIPQVSKT